MTTSLAVVVDGLHPLRDLAQRTLVETEENIANEISLVRKKMSRRDNRTILQRSGSGLNPKLQMHIGEISIHCLWGITYH